MANYTVNEDVVGGGFGGFGGGGWAGILVVLVILWVLFRDGFGRKDGDGVGYGYGRGYMYGDKFDCHAKGCVSTCELDKDVIKESDKTRMLIEKNQLRADDREFAKMSAEIAALKAEKHLEHFVGPRFAMIEAELCKVAKMSPCFVESRPIALQQCGFEPRRCDRD